MVAKEEALKLVSDINDILGTGYFKEETKRLALLFINKLLDSTFVQNNTYNYWCEVKEEVILICK
jgi:hypothetical protein